MKTTEYRKLLNDWWNALTDEDKKFVPISRNSVDLWALFKVTDTRRYYTLRSFLKKEINQIDEELIGLGVIVSENVRNEMTVKFMRDFVSQCEANPDLLWDVEFSGRQGRRHTNLTDQELDDYIDKFGLVSTTYLSNKLSCKVNDLELPDMLVLREQLNQLLLKHGVSLPYQQIKGSSHSVAYDLNHRRLFLQWEKSLTNEEKLELPMFGKVIDKKSFSHVIPPERSNIRYPLLKAEFQRFSKEVFDLKGMDYQTVKEREESRKEKALARGDSKLKVFVKLRDKTLQSISDFDSEKSDYADVQHAFAIASLKAESDSGISNYLHGYSHYCEFLASKGIPSESSFRECFEPWSLREFKEFLGNKINEEKLQTATANTILSSLRMTLDKLKSIRNFDFNYLPADGFEIVRSSLEYKPYSPHERAQLRNMFEQELALAEKKLIPYQKLDQDNADLTDPKIQARIMFEECCDCLPVYNGDIAYQGNTAQQNKFLNFVATRRLSLVELYEEWGVLTRRVLSRNVGIYVLKMAQILGMNLDPILDLELSDYQERHPLTNKPCLTYWKERSTGEKMIHLDLFHADLKWLSVSQKDFVANLFKDVKKLTSEVRKYAPSELKNRLFINFGTKVKALSFNDMSALYAELVDKYQLTDDHDEPLLLTTTRFRPTLVSDLIDAGVSLREIQYLLGHDSLYTTIKYIEQLDFDRVMRDKVRKALDDIYSNAVLKSKKNKKTSTAKQRKYDDSQIIMKTPLGGCKNIFDPPDFIKKSSMYVKGKPCSQYNKCLPCENVMLTEIHLPELFAMQRDYLASLEREDVVNTPYHVVVLENLALLDDILDPETSEFEEDILNKAKNDSLFIETTILDSWGSSL